MGADLLDDLNKQSISELSSSYVWPSVAFWVGNILVFIFINNYSVDLISLSSLSGEIITGVISFFAGVIVFTAWLVRLVVPFFYRVIQGVDINFDIFRMDQVKKYLKLKKSEFDLVVEHEQWQHRQKILLSMNQDEYGQHVEFKSFRSNVLDFIDQNISIELLSKDKFYLELRTFSGLIEFNRAIWESEDGFVKTQEKLVKYYQSVLEEIKIRLDLLVLRQSKVMDELVYRFPQNKEWILPSRFGNCWAAIESYTIINYSVNLSLLWSRLLAFVPKDYYEIIVRSKSRIDASVTGMVLFVLFSVTWIIPIFQKFQTLIGLFYILVSLIFFWMIYQMGVDSVISYGKLIKSAVDLYRHEVIKQMGFGVPQDIESEKNTWRDLQKLWTAALGKNLKFSTLDKSMEDKNV